MQVDEYIDKVDPKLRPQFARLASTVRKALPEAVEAVKWGVPYWAVNKVGVVSIAEYSQHINLYFLKGASLSSPLLEGTGTSMRHITVRTLADIDEREFVRLLEESGRLAAEAPVRKAPRKKAV
ncbi:MAG TPA: DUF1801 domain-containing protein [Nitrososphaerales archaeon]|nr:DUF1801 domain-containing protein [Nitrososphaerales archaeon]